jgi:hypothetical protein
MITLKDWMEAVSYRITEGSDYHHNGFGHNQYSLTAWNGDHDGWSLNIVFDTQDQTVYLAEACDYRNQRAYRLINPDFKDQFMTDDSEYRDQAWDDVDYTDLETDADWIEKASAIVAGRDYDDRVVVPVDFSDADLLTYMKMAHDRDMTFNQFVEEALREAIKEAERDPEAFKSRAQRWKEVNDLA